MIPYNPLQQLHNLDRSSPLFREQLRDFLRGDVYRDALQNIQSEDVKSVAEYLNSVSLHVFFLPAALKSV